MNQKGMSQTLTIVVAATVMMMVGLILTVMTQGSLTDLFTGSEESSCANAVKGQCSITNSERINLPSTCSELDNVSDVIGGEYSYEENKDKEIKCG